jgi:hypothetical protein
MVCLRGGFHSQPPVYRRSGSVQTNSSPRDLQNQEKHRLAKSPHLKGRPHFATHENFERLDLQMSPTNPLVDRCGKLLKYVILAAHSIKQT